MSRIFVLTPKFLVDTHDVMLLGAALVIISIVLTTLLMMRRLFHK